MKTQTNSNNVRLLRMRQLTKYLANWLDKRMRRGVLMKNPAIYKVNDKALNKGKLWEI